MFEITIVPETPDPRDERRARMVRFGPHLGRGTRWDAHPAAKPTPQLRARAGPSRQDERGEPEGRQRRCGPGAGGRPAGAGTLRRDRVGLAAPILRNSNATFFLAR